jgi:hypothetical protein
VIAASKCSFLGFFLAITKSKNRKLFRRHVDSAGLQPTVIHCRA